MKIHGDNFLGHWVLKLSGAHVSLLWGYIESIPSFIGAWRGLKLVFDNFPGIFLLIAVRDRLEDTCSSWSTLINWLWVIIAYSWIRLFEIYVHGDRLYEVQRISFIER